MGFLDDIGDEVTGFIAWLWNKLDPPERKTWCAAFYFVAQEDATIEYPENALDQKMADAVAAVTSAASSVDDYVHVVYRTVPSDPVTSDPVAKVVRFLGPETGSIFFPDCYDPGTTLALLDTGKDLTCFLKWVYRWCPADHYAIFIWGHSFGPAGLFEPGSGLSIPQPGLEALKEAFQQFQATRVAGDPKPPPVDKRQDASSGAGSSALEPWANDVDKKVEIILFQDCWMSTLETAFEIESSTAGMIASQSLLPVGLLYANFVWRYDHLLPLLPRLAPGEPLTDAFARAMTNELITFYVDHFNQVQYLSTIPITLLDLSKVPPLKNLMATLVGKLKGLPAAERKNLIELARLVKLDTTNPYDPILLAGDGALIDVVELCVKLRSTAWPANGTTQEQQAAQAAVTALETGLTGLNGLVKVNQEAHPPTSNDVGFRGVSVFHWPPAGVVTDDFIREAVRRSVGAYISLQLVQDTNWNELALEHKPQ